MSTPYKLPDTLFNFLAPPFLVFGSISLVNHLDRGNFGIIVFLYCENIVYDIFEIKFLKSTLQAVGIQLKKLRICPKKIKITQFSSDVDFRVYTSIKDN